MSEYRLIIFMELIVYLDWVYTITQIWFNHAWLLFQALFLERTQHESIGFSHNLSRHPSICYPTGIHSPSSGRCPAWLIFWHYRDPRGHEPWCGPHAEIPLDLRWDWESGVWTLDPDSRSVRCVTYRDTPLALRKFSADLCRLDLFVIFPWWAPIWICVWIQSSFESQSCGILVSDWSHPHLIM